jgi:rhamnosyltransferase
MKCAAIVVTFKPSVDGLNKLMSKLESQVEFVVVVNNGTAHDLIGFNFLNEFWVYCVNMGGNFGIASAQNKGIQFARQRKCDFVVFFDQDSMPSDDLVNELHVAFLRLSDRSIRVACLGPRYVDKRQDNNFSFSKVVGLKLVKITCNSDMDVIPVDHLISSGSLISIATIDAVGEMCEELFIDYVDLEWCERAKFLGYQAFGVCSLQMEHELGDDPIYFNGIAYPARSSLRHYYMFRNAFWMYKQPYVRTNWKFVDFLRLLRKYVFYSLFAKPRLKHFKMMTVGAWHGIVGRMGVYK